MTEVPNPPMPTPTPNQDTCKAARVGGGTGRGVRARMNYRESKDGEALMGEEGPERKGRRQGGWKQNGVIVEEKCKESMQITNVCPHIE